MSNYQFTSESLRWAAETITTFMKAQPNAECWEQDIYRHLVEETDELWWLEYTPGRRAIVVSSALSLMIRNGSVSVSATHTTGTGRRLLYLVNVLDRIVDAVYGQE